MERAIEAIERGDTEEAKRLCESMKHESQFMHDLLVDGMAGLISFVHERLGDDGWGVTDEAHEWSYGREGFPLYCTHCAFMNELLPIRWIGYPVYPSDPPASPAPVRIATSRRSSSRKSVHASIISRWTSGSIEFLSSGRLIVGNAIRSRFSYSSLSIGLSSVVGSCQQASAAQ
jgi:hypothetical protein